MNDYIKFLNTDWKTLYPLINLKDHLGLSASVIFSDSYMSGFQFIFTQSS